MAEKLSRGRKIARVGLMAALASLLWLGAGPALAQTGPTCTASLLNRTVRVNEDGSFAISVPFERGTHRVRLVCEQGGTVVYGQSSLFNLVPNGFTLTPPIAFGNVDPIPVALEVLSPKTNFTNLNETAQLTVLGLLANGDMVDLTNSGTTTFFTSNLAVGVVGDGLLEPKGRVRATGRGRVRISARYEGVVGGIELTMNIPNDSDRDGLPNEFEAANGLDPNDPGDAAEDPDGDGLSNLDEFNLGTDVTSADTDSDELTDSRELTLGTLATNPDTDGDALADSRELALGTNALSADSDGDGLDDGLEVALGIDPLFANLTTTVSGQVVDAQGASVPGASVVAFGRITGTADASGRFTLTRVPADQGNLTIFARRIDNAIVRDGRSNPTAPVPGGTTNVGAIGIGVVAGRVTGRIFDPVGATVPFARVTVLTGVDRRDGNADATGVYEFDRLPPGPIEIRAIDPRSALRGRAFGVLPDQGSPIVDLTLSASGTFVGTVFGRDGASPVGPGVPVSGAGPGLTVNTTTEPSSDYRLDYLPLGAWTLTATGPAADRGRTTSALSFTSQVVKADIGYIGQGTITGIVVEADDTPVPNAPVSLASDSGNVFSQSASTTAGTNGRFTFTGIYVGNFKLTGRNPLAPKAGVAGARIEFDGDSDDVRIVVGSTGTVRGTVFEANGTTVVPSASVVAPEVGRSATANGAGLYELLLVPTGIPSSLVATHPTNGDCGLSGFTLSQPDQVLVRDVNLKGFGGLDVTVRYADGAPVANQKVTLSPYPLNEGGGCFSQQVNTDSFGVARFRTTSVGAYKMAVGEPICGFSVMADVSVSLGTIGNAAVTFPPFGQVVGTVFQSDAVTPAPGFRVRLSGNSINKTTTSSGAGAFGFSCIKAGTYKLEAEDSFGTTLAENPVVPLVSHNEVVRRDLVIAPRGTVQGTVTDPNGDPAPGVGVTVSSLGNSQSRFVTTDVNGFYRATGILTGTIQVLARDNPRAFEGRGEGVLANEGEVITIDVQMEGLQVLARLWDANNYVYPVEFPNGGLVEATQGVFRGDNNENRHGFLLSLGQGGTFRRFTAEGSSLGQAGREAALTGTDESGLNVSRRIYVPRQGYFARYLEILENPTAAPISIDVALDTYLRFVSNLRDGFRFNDPPEIIGTSSGDSLLVVGPAAPTPDRWAVVDVRGIPATSALRELFPTTAHVFGGDGAPVAVSTAALTLDSANTYGQLRAVWEDLTVPAGGTVVLMHFVSQETGDAALAAAQRLVALPPEALVGLSAAELAAIANFVAPADGVGTVPALPPLDGNATGTVYNGDGVSVVPAARVFVRSSHPIFQRLLKPTANGSGVYGVTTNYTDDGNSVVLPRFDFTARADNPVTLVMSPSYTGSFGAGQTATRDIVFTDTGTIFGTVRRSNGEVVSSGSVKLTGATQLITVTKNIPTDGTFSFPGLPVGTYTLLATQGHPQGTGISTSASASLTAGGQSMLADLTMPPTGRVEGTVSSSAGFPIVGLKVELKGTGNFKRSMNSDTAGGYAFPDVPIGSYTVEATEPGTGVLLALPVTITDGGTAVVDLNFQGVGTVEVVATFPGGAAAANAPVSIRRDPLGSQFSSAGSTNAAGRLLIANVPVGGFAVRVSHPANLGLVTEVTGTLPALGVTVEVPVLVQVDDPPTAALTAPLAGSTFVEGAVMAVTATAADDRGVARVELWIDGVEVAQDTVAPYEFSAPALTAPGVGELQLMAVAFDTVGQRGDSAPVQIIVLDDASPPIVNLTAPAAGSSRIEGSTLTVSAVAVDNASIERVELSFQGVVFATDTTDPYSAQFTIPADFASAGPTPATFSARAVDRAGNAATANVAITVVPDAAPTITLTQAPPSGSVVREGAVLVFTATAGDDVGVQVDLLRDGNLVATKASAPFSFNFTVPPLASVTNPISVVLRARDTVNQTTSTAPVLLTVTDDAPPAVSLTSPAEGSEYFEGDVVAIQATATDDGSIARVDFFADGLQVGSDTSSPYAFDFVMTAGADLSSVPIRAVATDNTGQTGEATVTVTRRSDSEAPTVSLTSPLDGAVATLGTTDIMVLIDSGASAGLSLGIDIDDNGTIDTVRTGEIFAARQLLNALSPTTSKVGVISYNSGVSTRSSLTDVFTTVDTAIAGIASLSITGLPDFQSALNTALTELASTRARRAARPVVFLFGHGTGGYPTAAIQRAVDAGAVINTVAVGPGADLALYQAIAQATGGVATSLPDPRDFLTVLANALSFGIDSVVITAEATDNVGIDEVEFRVLATNGSIDLTLIDTSEPYTQSFSLATLSAETTIDITATARDVAGNETVTDAVRMTVLPATNPPRIVRLEPATGRQGTQIRILGRFLEPTRTNNTIFFNGATVASISGTKFELTFNAPVFTTDVPVQVTTTTGGSTNAVQLLYDADGDGLSNLDEAARGTNPNDTDSDDDGLADGAEVTRGTNPLDPDSDDDGLLDGFEVTNVFNPLVPGQESLDSDNDGLTNLEEQTRGTNPRDNDHDNDGLLDGAEVSTHLTNPLVADTDGGGRNDGQEIAEGTNPLNPADDLPTTTLPRILTDGSGFNWDFNSFAQVSDGSANAFDSAFLVSVNSSFNVPSQTLAFLEDGGRELRFGPANVSTLRLTRKTFVPASGEGFARYLEIVENPTALPITATINVFVNLGSNTGTQILATSSGNTSLDLGDRWSVTDDGTDGAGTPAVALVWGGPHARLAPSLVQMSSADTVRFDYTLTVPAGGRTILMHLAAQRTSRSAANARALALFGLTGEALSGLSAAEQADIVNFFAYPDADLDGLSDSDETGRGTNPNDADSDDDGMDDGFEVRWSFDPLNPADGPADPDADGLTNAQEQAAGTNPTVADTDADGLADGQEVNVTLTLPLVADTDADLATDGDEVNLHGTNPLVADTDGGGKGDGAEVRDGGNPLDPSDDLVPLGFNLTDALGFLWDVSTRGQITNGTSDAFDGGFNVRVNNTLSPSFTTALTEDGIRELVLGPWTQSGLTVRRKVFVPADAAFVRYLEVFDNPGVAPITFDAKIDTDVGSNTATVVVVTSSGDLTLTPADNFIITDDTDNALDPVVTHVLAGPAGAVRPSVASFSSDDISYTYRLTVEPGGRVILMHFGTQRTLRSQALTAAGELVALSGSALSGMTAAEQAQVVNFFAYADADFDRLSDADEAARGTDPNLPDTDGDGLLDGFEVTWGFDPLAGGDGVGDPDADGLNNLGEQTARTLPTVADTDGDGALDGQEVGAGSNPLVQDTDGDGLTDGEELNAWGSSPLVVDTDAGGRADGLEVQTDFTNPIDPSDDGRSRQNLVDAAGFTYAPTSTGSASVSSAATFGTLVVNTTTSPVSASLVFPDAGEGGRELRIGPATVSGGLRVSRKYFVPADDSFIRYLEIFENPTAAPLAATVRLDTFLNSSSATVLTATSSGDLAFDLGDRWLATDDGSPTAGTLPVASLLWGATGVERPRLFSLSSGSLSQTYELTVPAGGRVILMHFGVPASTREAALAQAQALEPGGGSAFAGLSAAERAAIVNFYAYADADRDGLGDEAEAAAGTDPADPDSDDDGIPDGLEVRFGYDPLAVNEVADFDGDGLGDAAEVLAGTDPARQDTDSDGLGDSQEVAELGSNPFRSDSDGDTLSDFDEVTVHGTSPILVDTDGGGRSDADEILRDQTDPLDPADDLGALTLPTTLFDGTNFLWDIQSSGVIANGSGSAFDRFDGGGFQQRVSGSFFSVTGPASVTLGGRQLQLGTIFRGDGISVRRRIFVPTDDGFIRYLEILENTGSIDRSVTLQIRSELGSATSTQVVSTSSLDTLVQPTDLWVVTDDTTDGTLFGRPAIAHVFAGSNAALRPSSVSLLSGGNFQVQYAVPVPAGERVIVMHFGVQAGTRAQAVFEAGELARLEGSALFGLTPEEQADVVNFFAYADRDQDGLADADEAAAGTDPDDPDSDDDGLGDGLEVSLGLDPNDPADGALDLDGDGLTNAAEILAGTDPAVADTDADGLADGPEVNAFGTDPLAADSDLDGLVDGSEVNTYGTDPVLADTDAGGQSDGDEVANGKNPLDPADDGVLVPRTLTDGAGFTWDLQSTGGIGDGTNDAYDGGFALRVDGVLFPSQFTASSELGGRETGFGPWTQSGLLVRRKVFVPTNDAFARFLEIFENPGSTEIEAEVKVETNLGSDSLTRIFDTSSGDNLWSLADRWVATDTNTSSTSRPPVVSVFVGATGALRPRAVFSNVPSDSQTFTYRVRVPAGGRVALMHFAAQAASQTAAEAKAEQLALLGGAALTGVSTDEQAAIANFFAYLDADHDGATAEQEALLGTDPNVADTDGDGIPDGVEARLGLDPLDSADGGADLDFDGLSNSAEAAAGTDPERPDTDGDGLADGAEVLSHGSDPFRPDTDGDTLTDGAEVTLHGTDPTEVDSDGGGQADGEEVSQSLDPTNPFDDTVALPRTLVDGGGYQWDLQSSGTVLNGSSDAWDGGLQLRVAGSNPISQTRAVLEQGSRELVYGPVVRSGLTVRRKVFVPTDGRFARFLDLFENPSLAPITVRIEIFSDLGSGTSTRVLGTSNGDLVLGFGDRWVVTDDASLGGGDPAVMQVFGGEVARVAPFASSRVNDQVSILYDLTVQPESRVALLHFAAQDFDGNDALATAMSLSLLPPAALVGLAPAEARDVVNFTVAPDTDGDGLSDPDEATAGTDPGNPDTDGDLFPDGYEIANGLNPLDPADGQLDADGDGLSAGGEHVAGTDPDDADTDDDGFTDGYEVASGLDPLDAGDGNRDADGDGLSESQELAAGTSPTNPDTDGDRMRDGYEVLYGFNPLDAGDAGLDADADGLTNLAEQSRGTHPRIADSDGDGLGDGDEVSRGTDPQAVDSDGDGLGDGTEVATHGTDPLDADTDGDGFDDGYEVVNGLDPLNPADGQTDADGDGLTAPEELALGTNPANPDTDDDQLSDGEEARVVHSNPLAADTDGDFVWDGEEVANGTSPLLADTDRGGANDGFELAEGTNPLDAGDDSFTLPLPFSLTDGDGRRWTVEGGGILRDDFGSGARERLRVGSFTFSSLNARLLRGERTVSVGPQIIFSPTLVEIRRKIFVPAGDGFARTLDLFRNPTSQPVTVPVVLESELGNRLVVVTTSDGDRILETADDFLVANDGPPALGLVWSDSQGLLRPTSVTSANDLVSVSFSLTVPPRSRVVLLHFETLGGDNGTAIDRTETLRDLAGNARVGLTARELQEIANFFTQPDGDGDGLSDAEEIALGTDPANPDTDGDGLGDGFEVAYGFDPLVAGDEALDPDGDGLDNLGEQGAGTRPDLADTDGDGLDDGEELADFGTDPLAADSDGDGLGDGDEVDVHLTDPLVADTDAGGRSDGDEVLLDGTDPLVAGDDVLPIAVGSTLNAVSPVVAADPWGGLHLAWLGTEATNFCAEVFYAHVGGDGAVLIAPTQVTTSCSGPAGPALDVDRLGFVHLLWQTTSPREVVYAKLDPLVDDRDGTPADPAAIAVVAPVAVFSTQLDDDHRATVAGRSDGGVWLLWTGRRYESELSVQELHVARLDASGNVVTGDLNLVSLQAAFGGESDPPAAGTDAADNLHLTWSDDNQLSYFMLGSSGSIFISRTRVDLTGVDTQRLENPSLEVLADGRVRIGFFARDPLRRAVRMTLDPALDPQDGGPANLSAITVENRATVTAGLGGPMSRPAMELGSDRTWYTWWEQTIEGTPALFAAAGTTAGVSLVPAQQVVAEPTFCSSCTGRPVPVQLGGTIWVPWSGYDATSGDSVLYLSRVDPDLDGDGLAGGEEARRGTNAGDADSDDDGLSDGFEVRWGFNPLAAGEQAADGDADSLTNLGEQTAGTEPVRADTDDDGLADGAEVAAGTLPLRPDSDGDGLTDGEEVPAGTSPTDPDSDDDGLLDGFEVEYGFDPLTPGEQTADPDTDWLDNLTEQELGTNPLLEDTDGDGLGDGHEEMMGSDPTLADTDGDGLGDGEEVNDYGTNPLDTDTDDGGIDDGDEVGNGTDPLDPLDDFQPG
ncbi:MAG TPA: carboxypeptidase regulatory-like domain-containing protein [Thermoanaerobaculia bacterium]|nr:carboxypeptidase regulatory-like domain-containing protein [Thermoanaerobaculia bacterium]